MQQRIACFGHRKQFVSGGLAARRCRADASTEGPDQKLPDWHHAGVNCEASGQLGICQISRMNAGKPATKETILLVDDEQSVRAIVLKILRRAGYNVLEAENGDAALEVAEAHPDGIDLLITDMFMPGLRGPEVADRLARTRPGLRVLFMSGYADQDARTGVPAGANFLNKPFSGADLAKTVEEVLRGPAVS